MRERDIEKALVDAVHAAGGECFKWVSPGRNGVPDRIIMMPGGIVFFIELKAPGKGLAPIQQRTKERIRSLGFVCIKLDGVAYIPAVINQMIHLRKCLEKK